MAEMKTKASEREPVSRPEDLQSQIRSLRTVVVLLLLACMVMSASFNMYLFYQNVEFKTRAADAERRLMGYGDMHRFLQRLVNELNALSSRDQAVADVLRRHHNDLVSNNLLDQTRGMPE